MSKELVHLEVANRVATITLDSPENRNAFSTQLSGELADHISRAQDDPEVRVLVLTGTGTTFCAGADLKSAGSVDLTSPRSPASVMLSLWSSTKPVVVALNGHARAGGIGLIAAADVVVAPLDATFGFTEVRLGLSPAVIAVLCQAVMPARLLSRYLLTGESFDASEAVEAGLVTKAVEREHVASTVDEIVGTLLQGEPRAVAATKSLIRDLPAMGIPTGIRFAGPLSETFFRSEAAQEGMAAFRERRAPAWAQAPAATP